MTVARRWESKRLRRLAFGLEPYSQSEHEQKGTGVMSKTMVQLATENSVRITELKEKGMKVRQISDLLTKEVGAKVGYNAVLRVYNGAPSARKAKGMRVRIPITPDRLKRLNKFKACHITVQGISLALMPNAWCCKRMAKIAKKVDVSDFKKCPYCDESLKEEGNG